MILDSYLRKTVGSIIPVIYTIRTKKEGLIFLAVTLEAVGLVADRSPCPSQRLIQFGNHFSKTIGLNVVATVG
jgi:hypothetical protein